jgi:hypothetical protein
MATIFSFVGQSSTQGGHLGLLSNSNSKASIAGTNLQVGFRVVVADNNHPLTWSGSLTYANQDGTFTTDNLVPQPPYAANGDSLDNISVTVYDSTGNPSPALAVQAPPFGVGVWVGPF